MGACDDVLMVPLSVLDLAPIVEGGDVSQALANSLSLARLAESLNFKRFWLAEHHNFPGVASAATSVVIAHIAGGTSRIRVGAGGIMLPNHVPYVIAEQFGTLEALFPGRIDLGLGRAPGSDIIAQRALRKSFDSARAFPDDVRELMGFFRDEYPVRAVPGAGANVPLWILGSSLFGAQLAAELGLPYAFASHFAPDQLKDAVALYRARFRPSNSQAKPYVMLGLNVIAADTDEEARFLFSSLEQVFLALRTGNPRALPAPVRDLDVRLDPASRALLQSTLRCSVVGSEDTVRRGLEAFVEQTGADELMVTCQIFDHEKRLQSLRLTESAARTG